MYNLFIQCNKSVLFNKNTQNTQWRCLPFCSIIRMALRKRMEFKSIEFVYKQNKTHSRRPESFRCLSRGSEVLESPARSVLSKPLQMTTPTSSFISSHHDFLIIPSLQEFVVVVWDSRLFMYTEDFHKNSVHLSQHYFILQCELLSSDVAIPGE